MKTEQLVASLVADRAQSSVPLGRAVARAVALGVLVSLAIFAFEFGPRVDLAAAFATWRFDLKLLLVLAALVAASGACIALARPLSSGTWRRGVVPVVLIAAAGLASDHGLYDALAQGGQAHVIDSVVAEVLSDDGLKSDRIHPNRAGYGVMARAAAEVLERCR